MLVPTSKEILKQIMRINYGEEEASTEINTIARSPTRLSVTTTLSKQLLKMGHIMFTLDVSSLLLY
jgi:hypothetical protein